MTIRLYRIRELRSRLEPVEAAKEATDDEIQLPDRLKPVFNVTLRIYGRKREWFHIEMRLDLIERGQFYRVASAKLHETHLSLFYIGIWRVYKVINGSDSPWYRRRYLLPVTARRHVCWENLHKAIFLPYVWGRTRYNFFSSQTTASSL